MRAPALLLVVPLLLAAVPVAFQDGVAPTAGYGGTRSVYIDRDAGYWQPDLNYHVSDLRADAVPSQTAVLLRWDVSTLPSATTVDSASLIIDCDNSSASAFPFFQMARAWSATQATWNQATPGTPWQTPGAAGSADRSTTVLAQTVTNQQGSMTLPLNASGVAAVQAWVNQPTQNFGLVLPGRTGDAFAFRGSLASVASRPLLNITSGGVTYLFRNGEFPTTGYNGQSDAVIASGPSPMTVNYVTDTLHFSSEESVLLSFNLGGVVPPWATVVSADLKLQAYVTSASPTLAFSNVAKSWTESSVTFLSRDGVTAWGTPGLGAPADRSASIFSAPLTSQTPVFVLPDAGLNELTQWVRGAVPNDGWLITTTGGTAGVNARRSAATTARPRLELSYLEGRLAFADAPPTVRVSAAQPFTVVRQRYDDAAPISTGAPELPLALESTSDGGEFSLDGVDGWSSSLVVDVPAESDRVEAFYRDALLGTPTLSVDAGAAWVGGAQTWGIGEAPPVLPADGGAPDGGAPDGGPAHVRLAVGCGCSEGEGLPLLALVLGVLLVLRRR